jgi:hypothetical protein
MKERIYNSFRLRGVLSSHELLVREALRLHLGKEKNLPQTKGDDLYQILCHMYTRYKRRSLISTV